MVKHLNIVWMETPQGGIVSALLFNIYMLEFDQYIYNEFINPILKLNTTRQTRDDRNKSSRLYGQLRTKTNTALRRYRKAKQTLEKNDPKIKELYKKFKAARA